MFKNYSTAYLRTLPDVTPGHVRMMTPAGEIRDQEYWSVDQCLTLHNFTLLARDQAEWYVLLQQVQFEEQQWRDRYSHTGYDMLLERELGIRYFGDDRPDDTEAQSAAIASAKKVQTDRWRIAAEEATRGGGPQYRRR